jgi:ribonuclease HII
MLLLGIDEAGRGSVVGPMMIAGAMIDEKDEHKLREIGVKDSKLLTPKRREQLYAELKKILKDYVVLKVSAQDIDELRKRKNLNLIEAERMAEIIRTMKADVAYVDAPQVSTGKFRDVLEALAKSSTRIVAENYADKKFPVCSAASILAKVERDADIEQIKRKVGVNFGVGYPHDERTISFVKECLKENRFMEYIRQSWVTVLEMKGKEKQKLLAEFKED